MSITGNLSLNDDPTFNFGGSLAPGTYIIASYGGALSGKFTTLNIPTGDTINYGTGNDSSITLSAVPEPSTLVLLGIATCLVGYGWRRRATRRTAKQATLDRHDDPPILSFPSHASQVNVARRAA